MNLENVLLVSALIFAIGIYGVLSRRNVVTVLMSLELMFNAVVVAAVAFARFTPSAGLVGSAGTVEVEALRGALTGHAFAIFVIAVAAAEAALALALVFAMYRARETVEITDAATMRH
ncbi:MAG: NADH-quinone oxidoreductase subunit NuoK [Dehalococcoidia bacterium]